MTSIHDTVLQALSTHYHIEREAGRGGMGVVYQARDQRLDRLVAIKVLQLHQTAQADLHYEVAERFQREARALAGLSHPNLVTIYDVGEVEGFSYMIMEYVQGKDIGELLAQGRKLPPALVASIAHQTCLALAVAHEHGIVHRDIKPANLILSPKGQVKLMDFGIAQLQEQQESAKLTQAGSVMGSILYASPEQLQDARQVGFRSDIYALGISLFEMLTGQSPYDGESLSEIMLAILSQTEIPSVTHFEPQVPVALAQIIARACTKKPDTRYASAEQMAQAIAPLLSGQPASTQMVLDLEDSKESASALRTVRDITLIRRTQIDKKRIAQLQQQYTWMAEEVKTWPQAVLTQLSLEQTLSKVTERNIFGKGLSGCLVVDERFFLFLANGFFVGALDLHTHHVQQQAFYDLPTESQHIALYTLSHEDMLPVIFSDILSGRGQHLQENLDSSLMDLAPLLHNLQNNECFTGYITCLAHDNVYYYAYDQGKLIFAGNAQGNTFHHEVDWRNPHHLVLRDSVLMHVLSCQPEIIGSSLVQILRSKSLHHQLENPEKLGLQALCDFQDSDWPLEQVREVKMNTRLVEPKTEPLLLQVGTHDFDLSAVTHQNPGVAFAHFLLARYFYLLHSSGNANSLKYIYQWIPGIDRFLFAQHLKGEHGELHYFDAVAYGTPSGDSTEKILFLVRSGPGDAECLADFVTAVNQVKQRLVKTGDIGGAFYLAQGSLSDEALKIFQERTVEPRKSLMGLGSLDKLTRYKGFVRIGMKRGYHLNVLTYHHTTDDHSFQFEPVAPLLH